jgi:hypothetical protein
VGEDSAARIAQVRGEFCMTNMTAVQIRLEDKERDLLDRYRRDQQNPPSRAAAVRELTLTALFSVGVTGLTAGPTDSTPSR